MQQIGKKYVKLYYGLIFRMEEYGQAWAVSGSRSTAGSQIRNNTFGFFHFTLTLPVPPYLSELLWWRQFEVWGFSASSDPSRPPSGQTGGRRLQAAGRATTARAAPVKEQEREGFDEGLNTGFRLDPKLRHQLWITSFLSSPRQAKCCICPALWLTSQICSELAQCLTDSSLTGS